MLPRKKKSTASHISLYKFVCTRIPPPQHPKKIELAGSPCKKNIKPSAAAKHFYGFSDFSRTIIIGAMCSRSLAGKPFPEVLHA